MIPSSHPLAVVPVLIGPAQVLLPILFGVVLAVLGKIVASLKPSALRATIGLLWKKKIGVGIFLLFVVGVVYAWPRVFAGHVGGNRVEISSDQWPMYGGAPDRRDLAGAAAPDPDSGGIIWSDKKEFATFMATPAIVGNLLYVTGEEITQFNKDGHSGLFCIDTQTGKIHWPYAPSDLRATYSSPVVGEKCVVTGEGFHTTPECRITCLDAGTGQKIWSVTAHGKVESTPCIYKGKAYAGAGDDGFYCIALQPGPDGKPKVLWHLEGTNPIHQADNYPQANPGKRYQDCDGSPVAYNGYIYFGLGIDGQAVVCVDAESGVEKWRTTGKYPVFCNPAIVDDKLFVGMGNGNLINDADAVRDQRWPAIKKAMEAKNATKAEMDQAYGDLGPGGVIWALDPATGARAMPDYKLPNTVLGGISGADHRVYFGCLDNYFRSMTTDGSKVVQWNAHEPIATSPAVGQKNVYFVTKSGQLIGLDKTSLQPVWQMALGSGDYFFSSPVINDGHIYVGTASEGIVCAGEPGGAKSEPIWSGSQGVPGGWIDGNPIPASGTFAKQFPEEETGDAAMLAPAVFHRDAIYATITQKNQTTLNKLIPVKGPKASFSLTTKWSFPLANSVVQSPVAAGSTIYVSDGKPGDANRKVTAIDIESAKPAWTYPIDTAASGAMLLMDDHLIVNDKPDTITSLGISGDQAGKPQWSHPMKSIVGSPASIDGIILVSQADPPALVALDAVGGGVLWQAALPARPTSGPVVHNDPDQYRAAIATERGIVCVNLFTSQDQIAWEDAIGPAGGLTANANYLAASSGDSVAAFKWDGTKLGLFKTSQINIAPLLAGDVLLFNGPKAFQQVDLSTVTAKSSAQPKQWMTSDWLGKMTAAPILVDSYFYYGSDQKGLVVVKPNKK